MIALMLMLGLVSPALAGGPNFSNSGGIGNGAYTPAGSSGEPCGTGATWCINGATGAINGGTVAVGGAISAGSVTATGVGSFGSVSGNASAASALSSDSGALARAFSDRLVDQVSVKDFCSAAISSNNAENPSLDATPCIQAAVTAMCARTNFGGRIFIPAGSYYIAATVNVTCSGLDIAGAGIGDRYVASGTQIIAGHRTDTNPVFLAKVTGFTSQAGETNAPSPSIFSSGLAIHDMAFVNQGASVANGRSGAMMELDFWQQAYVYNINAYAVCTAAKVYGGFFVSFSNVIADNFQTGCSTFALSGDVTKSYTTLDVVSFDRVKVNAGASGACYAITDRVQTVWWRNTTCETSGFALQSSCPTMTNALYCPGFFTLQDFEAEYMGTAGGNLIDINDLVDGFKMTQSWLRGFNSGNFVNNLLSFQQSRFTTTDLLTVSISDSWLKGSGGDALYVNAPGAMTITGNHIYGASHFNAGAFGGVTLDTKAKGVSIVSNVFCGGDWLADVGNQMTGIRILGVSDYITVTGNVFQGDVSPPSGQHNGCSSALSNTSSGTHTTATGNVGP